MIFIAIEFNTKGEVLHAVPAVPANPTADEWYDKGDESGYSKFSFTLPTKDVDGNPIDDEKLSYSIYTDNDQLFTFDAETYSDDLTEDMTEIPYSIYKKIFVMTFMRMLFISTAPMRATTLCSQIA